MAGESEVLRQLRKIQVTVPDKDFFTHLKAEMEAGKRKMKKKKGGLFGAPFLGGKKTATIELEIARESIKSFNNSFQNRTFTKQQQQASKEFGIMSVQEMKEFRIKVKESAEMEDDSAAYGAVEAIVKFIDLKNSGAVVSKQNVLFDCLKKLAMALLEDGGLSMFHSTWFLSVYREYLRHYKMFRPGEFEYFSKHGSKDVKAISKGLFQKQYELPHYLQLINEGKRDIKQLIRYSKDPYVKRSAHGQKGCSFQHIKRIFHEKAKDGGTVKDQNYLNEVNILMSYALFFSRIPMMRPLVDRIIKSIPNLDVETTLFREKLIIAQKLIDLDLANGIARNDGSDLHNKKLYDRAYGVYRYCTDLIRDNRLTKDTLKSDIYTYPFLKQANILITYRRVFFQSKSSYMKMLENSLQVLRTLEEAAGERQRHLMKFAEYVNLYDRTINAIITQINADRTSEDKSKKTQQASN